jgi:hypothetical protein
MQPFLQYFKAMFNPGPGVLLFALRTIAAELCALSFNIEVDWPDAFASKPAPSGDRHGFKLLGKKNPATECGAGQRIWLVAANQKSS